MAYTLAHKRANYKWRANNKEKWNSYMCDAVKKSYEKNKTAINAYRRAKYTFDAECKIFRKICFE
jgi:hypothetical protein